MELYIIKSEKIPEIYIGKTKHDTKTRFSQHKASYKTKKGLLYEAMRIYGPENFEAIPYKPIRKIVTEKELCEAETFLIKSFKEAGVKLLNIKSGGVSSTKGRKQTVKAKTLISEAFKKKWSDPNYRNNRKNHKITSSIAIQIRDLHLSGKSRKEISELTGINYVNVCHVVAGRKWHSVTGIDSKKIKMDRDERHKEIKRLFLLGEKSVADIAHLFSINKTTVYDIVNRI